MQLEHQNEQKEPETTTGEQQGEELSRVDPERGDNDFEQDDIKKWNVDSVIYWLNNIVYLTEYNDIFQQDEIDG